MPWPTDTRPPHGLQIPDCDIRCINGEATTIEVGEVVCLDQNDTTASSTNFRFGDPASAYAVTHDPVVAESSFAIFVVAQQRVARGQSGLFRLQGKARLRTSGTPVKAAPLVNPGSTRALITGATGHVGKKVIARVEVTASGSPEFADVLFDGLNGFGAAPL